MTWSRATTSARKTRLPRDWAQRRQAVLSRAGWRCEATYSDGSRCDQRANQCDHIVAGDDHSLANLQALCSWHHARKSSAEGAAARKAKRDAERDEEQERHPGLLW